ncbi:MAG: hypothetical protein CMJ46_01090 [Planctomyces sp.]|nr:hypothetical protein [Planctomyces sp.]
MSFPTRFRRLLMLFLIGLLLSGQTARVLLAESNEASQPEDNEKIIEQFKQHLTQQSDKTAMA